MCVVWTHTVTGATRERGRTYSALGKDDSDLTPLYLSREKSHLESQELHCIDFYAVQIFYRRNAAVFYFNTDLF